jgi:lysozyme family protein
MVKDADILLRRGYARPAKKPLLIGTQLVATVGGFMTGILADMDKLRDPNTLVLFVVVLAVTITAAVLALLKE